MQKQTQNKEGLATYRNGKLYFNKEGWSLIKSFARIKHKTPRQIVIGALKRAIKQGKF